MIRHLFTVEFGFIIRGRGIIGLLPGLLPQGDELFSVGDPLRLLRPDGSELRTVIEGFDFANVRVHGGYAIYSMLSKSEVPIGTEVWST